MDKKESKRKGDDQSREPGRPPQAPEPERRYPDSNRPDTLRPGPGERKSREAKEGPRQSDESRVISAEYDDEDDEDIDDADIDDEVRPARPA
jgi:hypothetical protein